MFWYFAIGQEGQTTQLKDRIFAISVLIVLFAQNSFSKLVVYCFYSLLLANQSITMASFKKLLQVSILTIHQKFPFFSLFLWFL